MPRMAKEERPVRLSQERIDRYDRDGFLIFPELFSPAEVAALRSEVERVSRLDAEGIVREVDSGPPKIMLRLHETDGPTASPEYRAFACQSRTLGVARQVLRDDSLYLHHSKVNLKAAIQGSAWPWHQDFGTWHLDGIERPAMTTVMLMLNDSTEMNGCLYFLPGSHRSNRQVPYWDDTTAYKLWAVRPVPWRFFTATCCMPRATTFPRTTGGRPICATTRSRTARTMSRTRGRTTYVP